MSVLVQLLAVHDATESFHAVEAAGYQVFPSPFDLAAPDRKDIF